MGEEIGTLIVVVLKARNLRDKHTFYKQDAYTQASLNKDSKKTQVDVKGGQHPVWDEELRFPVFKRVSDETRKLEVSCWSKEPRTDDCVGRGSVDITETLKTGEFDDWVPLKMEDGAYRGDLYLEMTYYAKTPPLQRRASKWKSTERLTRPTSEFTYTDVSPVPVASSVGATHSSDGVLPTVVESSAAEEELPLPGYPEDTHNPLYSNGQRATANTHLSPAPNHDTLPPLPEEPAPPPAAIPAILRPGGGKRISPQTSPKAVGGLLPTEHPVHAHANSSRRDPSPPVQAPLESVPPYLRPNPSHTPIPEPQLSVPQACPPPTQNYPPPSHIYHNPPPQSYPPPAQSYVAPPQLYPPQIYGPPPPTQPYPPVPQSYGTPSGPYGSPPHRYAPPALHTQAYIPPYGPPPPQAPAYPPSPYSYPPPSRAEDERAVSSLPDPYLQARYQTPLPLPDEPDARRGHTPASSHTAPRRPSPSRTVPAQTPTQAQPQPQSKPVPQESAQQERTKAHETQKSHSRGPSREERDRLLALEFEQEEAERLRRLREQEERDNELARQLDLELNLQEESARREAAGEAAEGVRVRGQW